MTKEELEILYKSKIIPASKEPYHFEKYAQANTIIEAYNPICGDKYQLYLEITDGIIQSAYFHGFGCAISKASTSILARKVEGMRLEEVVALGDTFIASLTGVTPVDFDDECLKILNELKNFDGRIDCIKSSWEAITHHLKEEQWK